MINRLRDRYVFVGRGRFKRGGDGQQHGRNVKIERGTTKKISEEPQKILRLLAGASLQVEESGGACGGGGFCGWGSSRTAVSPHLDAGEKRQQRDRAGADGQAPVRPSFSLSIFFSFAFHVVSTHPSPFRRLASHQPAVTTPHLQRLLTKEL